MAKKSLPISDQLRKAIGDSGLSCYEICARINARGFKLYESTLTRFLKSERDLKLTVIDQVGAVLGLRLERETKK